MERNEENKIQFDGRNWYLVPFHRLAPRRRNQFNLHLDWKTSRRNCINHYVCYIFPREIGRTPRLRRRRQWLAAHIVHHEHAHAIHNRVSSHENGSWNYFKTYIVRRFPHPKLHLHALSSIATQRHQKKHRELEQKSYEFAVVRIMLLLMHWCSACYINERIEQNSEKFARKEHTHTIRQQNIQCAFKAAANAVKCASVKLSCEYHSISCEWLIFVPFEMVKSAKP